MKRMEQIRRRAHAASQQMLGMAPILIYQTQASAKSKATRPKKARNVKGKSR